MSEWSWKVADPGANAELGLLYEPGTWGDLLKAAWAVPLARALAAQGPLRIVDPFAGAASYPLVEAAARRLHGAPRLGIEELLEPHLQEGRVPSTGALAQEAAGEAASLLVFDVHAARLATWKGRERCEVPAGVFSGDALLEKRGAEAGLLLLDPYDLFERYEALLPLALAPGAPLLLYLYNKAPRGPKELARYRALRDRLAALAGERVVRVGRVPSDAVLPRAYHEVLLVGPAALVEPLDETLREATFRLSRHVGDLGAWEDP
jgi:hypothetical protein